MPLHPEMLNCGRTRKSTLIPEGRLPDIETVRDLLDFGDLLTRPAVQQVPDKKEEQDKDKILPKPTLRPKEILKEPLHRDKETVIVCTYDQKEPLSAAIGRVDHDLGAVVIERMVIADGENSSPILEKVQEIGTEKLGQKPKIFVTEFAELNNEEETAIHDGRVVMVGCINKFVQVSL